MKKITIEVPDGKIPKWVDGVLTLVDEKPKDITMRIKSLSDAISELGSNHPYVREYGQLFKKNSGSSYSPDIMAFFRLRIICAALNEGWEPQFANNEVRWYPLHWLYYQEDIDNMDEEDKMNRCMMSTADYRTEYAGFAYAGAADAATNVDTFISSTLVLKDLDLAEYCGTQFIKMWADFKLRRK